MWLDWLALTARLALAAVVAVAGFAKLRDRAGTSKSLEDFGVPARLAGPGAVVLPIVELLVAAVLVAPATATAGVGAAITLLAIFSLAVAINLIRGRAPRCHCFGNLHSTPTSWRTVERNLALAGLGALSWIGSGDARSGAVALSVAVLGFLLVRVGRARGRLPGDPAAGGPSAPRVLSPGMPAPAFSATDARTGRRVTRDELLASRLPLLLVFTSGRCESCAAFLPDVAEWQRTHRERITIAVASDGNADAAGAEARKFSLTRVLVDQDLALYHAYRAYGTPSAVLVRPDATVGSYVAAGSDAIADLFARVLRGEFDGASAPPLIPGMVAPAFDLAALDGDTSLVDLREETVLVFWNPAGDSCRAMRRDLRRWEADRPRGAPRLVIVSSGDAESSRGERFTSAVLLDPGSQVGAAYGAHGTPSAVRVGADGRVASPMVYGAAAVLAMLGSPDAVEAP